MYRPGKFIHIVFMISKIWDILDKLNVSLFVVVVVFFCLFFLFLLTFFFTNYCFQMHLSKVYENL